MTNEEKLKVILESDEVLLAVKMLHAVMMDIDAKNFVFGEFEYNNEVFNLAYFKKGNVELKLINDQP